MKPSIVAILVLIASSTLAAGIARAQEACFGSDYVAGPEPTDLSDLGDGRIGYSRPLPTGQPQRVHAILSYEGTGNIRVGRTDEPVVLVVNAYDAGIWTIEADPDARIQAIHLGGYEPQEIVGVPDGVPVIRDACRGYVGSPKTERSGPMETNRHEAFVRHVRAVTGLAVTDLQYAYGGLADYRIGMPVAPSTPMLRSADDMAARLEMERDVEMLGRMRDKGLFPSTKFSYVPEPKESPFVFEPKSDRGDGRPGADCPGARRGTAGTDRVKCAWGASFAALGGGQDSANFSWDDQIVDPGSGDDIVDLGWGTDVLVLNEGWGRDTVSKTCHDSKLREADRTKVGGVFEMVNYVVFGPGIDPSEIVYEQKNSESGVLTRRGTGDRVEIEGDCFDFLFHDGIPGVNYRREMSGRGVSAASSGSDLSGMVPPRYAGDPVMGAGEPTTPDPGISISEWYAMSGSYPSEPVPMLPPVPRSHDTVQDKPVVVAQEKPAVTLQKNHENTVLVNPSISSHRTFEQSVLALYVEAEPWQKVYVVFILYFALALAAGIVPASYRNTGETETSKNGKIALAATIATMLFLYLIATVSAPNGQSGFEFCTISNAENF